MADDRADDEVFLPYSAPSAEDETEGLAAFLVTRTFEVAPQPTGDAFDETELPDDLEILTSRLAEGLEQAVARAVDGADHIAVLTGGGVDSGALLAMAVAKARGASPKHVEAIALHFGGPGDDRPHLARLCGDLGMSPVKVTPVEAVPFFARALRLGGQPDPWPTTAFELALAARARDVGAVRVLGGFGGDQIFNGQGRHLAQLVRKGHPAQAVREALALRTHESASALVALRDYLVGPMLVQYVPEWLRRKRRTWRQKRSWMGPQTLRFVERYFSAPARANDSLTPGSRYREWMSSAWRHELEFRGQALEREVGVSRRNPYLDRELLRLVARIPPRALLVDGQQKGLFRRAVARWLPESLRRRQDKAWLEPAIETLVRHPDVEPRLEALFDCRELSSRGLVDAKHFPSVIRDELAHSSSAWVDFWPVLAAEAWLRGC